MPTRKEFIRQSTLIGAGSVISGWSKPTAGQEQSLPQKTSGWPDGARLVISVSMQFEAGGEPETGFDSPFPPNLEKGFTDLAAKT